MVSEDQIKSVCADLGLTEMVPCPQFVFSPGVAMFRARYRGIDCVVKFCCARYGAAEAWFCKTLSQLSPANSFRLLAERRLGNEYVCVTAFENGSSLADAIRSGRVVEADFDRLIAELTRLTQLLIDHGIAHYDLTTNNVWVSDDGTVKLYDGQYAAPKRLDDDPFFNPSDLLAHHHDVLQMINGLWICNDRLRLLYHVAGLKGEAGRAFKRHLYRAWFPDAIAQGFVMQRLSPWIWIRLGLRFVYQALAASLPLLSPARRSQHRERRDLIAATFRNERLIRRGGRAALWKTMLRRPEQLKGASPRDA